MWKRWGVVAVLGMACADSSLSAPDLGPARVVIESAAAVRSDVDEVRVSVGIRNAGGAGAFYLEFASPSSVPNQPGPITRSETVEVLAAYRETVIYTVSGTTSVYSVRAYSRPANSASYTRSDCYVIQTSAHC